MRWRKCGAGQAAPAVGGAYEVWPGAAGWRVLWHPAGAPAVCLGVCRRLATARALAARLALRMGRRRQPAGK